MRKPNLLLFCSAALLWPLLPGSAAALSQNSAEGAARGAPSASAKAGNPAANPKDAEAGARRKPLAPQRTPAAIRAELLDELFTRLKAAAAVEEAQGVAGAIQHVWLQSHSDTANLLMGRALTSMKDAHYPLALSLLDKIVVLEPDWAEAWNQRAIARFLADDLDGAMADIEHVLKREPRHFAALAGMGAILEREGFDKEALQILKRSLEIYPLQPELRKAVEKLEVEAEGRPI